MAIIHLEIHIREEGDDNGVRVVTPGFTFADVAVPNNLTSNVVVETLVKTLGPDLIQKIASGLANNAHVAHEG